MANFMGDQSGARKNKNQHQNDINKDRWVTVSIIIDCWPYARSADCEEFIYIAVLAWDGFETR